MYQSFVCHQVTFEVTSELHSLTSKKFLNKPYESTHWLHFTKEEHGMGEQGRKERKERWMDKEEAERWLFFWKYNGENEIRWVSQESLWKYPGSPAHKNNKYASLPTPPLAHLFQGRLNKQFVLPFERGCRNPSPRKKSERAASQLRCFQ